MCSLLCRPILALRVVWQVCSAWPGGGDTSKTCCRPRIEHRVDTDQHRDATRQPRDCMCHGPETSPHVWQFTDLVYRPRPPTAINVTCLRSALWMPAEILEIRRRTYSLYSLVKVKRSIAVRNTPHRYGNSRAIWDHTVLPATRQRWHSRLYPGGAHTAYIH